MKHFLTNMSVICNKNKYRKSKLYVLFEVFQRKWGLTFVRNEIHF